MMGVSIILISEHISVVEWRKCFNLRFKRKLKVCRNVAKYLKYSMEQENAEAKHKDSRVGKET